MSSSHPEQNSSRDLKGMKRLKGWLWSPVSGLLIMVTFTQRKGVTDPLRPQGPDVRLPKIVTLHQGDKAARAVMALLTKTWQNQNMFTTGPCVAWTWDHNQPFRMQAENV